MLKYNASMRFPASPFALTIILLLVHTLGWTTILSQLDHGEPCELPTTTTTTTTAPAEPDLDDPCNSTLYYQCIDGRCLCQPGMTWSRDEECVSKVDEPCQTADLEQPIKHCTENAFCAIPDSEHGGLSPICQCVTDYLPLPNNITCLPGPGAACDRTEDCNRNALLSCQAGKCRCDQPETQIWDPVKSKCVSLVGGSCDEEDTAFIKRPCFENTACNLATRKCECPPERKETSDKTCLLDYGANCTRAEDCHSFYTCHHEDESASCACDPLTSVYDEEHQVCAILAGQPCSSSSPFCVERAQCSDRYKSCRCETDFIQTTAGYCVGGYRADCSVGTDCNEDGNLDCDTTTKQCNCKVNYEYSADSRKCVGFVGTNCNVSSDCFELAECASSSLCKCRAGYSPTPDHQCLVSHGRYCVGPGRCNPYDFLQCNDAAEQCGCENSAEMVYSPDKLTCVAMAETTCYRVKIEQRQLGCVGNATCEPIETSSTLGKCTCTEGLSNVNGLCELASGASRVGSRSVMAVIFISIWVILFR